MAGPIKPVARHPNGHVIYAQLAPRIERLRATGMSLPQIAEKFGLRYHVVHNAAKHGRVGPRLDTRPEMPLLTLARELHITRSDTLREYAERHGVTIIRYGRRTLVSAEDAGRLRSLLGERITADEARGWLTPHQAAAVLGISYDAFAARYYKGSPHLKDVRRARVGGNAFYYEPRSIQLLAAKQPVALVRPPSDGLTPPQVASALKLSRQAVDEWPARGCPVHRTKRGHRYFKRAELVAWLRSRTRPWMHSYARALEAA